MRKGFNFKRKNFKISSLSEVNIFFVDFSFKIILICMRWMQLGGFLSLNRGDTLNLMELIHD